MLCVLCFLMLFCWSCSGEPTTGEPTNTDSHWLEFCVEDDTCGALSCHLGVCSKLCTVTSNCKGLSQSSCAAFEVVESQKQAQLCTLSCRNDAQCQQLNPEMRCREQVCVLETWSSVSPDTTNNNNITPSNQNQPQEPNMTQWKHTLVSNGAILATPTGLCDVDPNGQDTRCFGSVNRVLLNWPDNLDQTKIIGFEQCGWGLTTDNTLTQWGICSIGVPDGDVLQWGIMGGAWCVLDGNGQVVCQNKENQINLNDQLTFKSIGYNANTTCALSLTDQVHCVSNTLSPYQLEGTFEQLSVGYGSRLCGMKQNRLFCWENASAIVEQTILPFSPTQLITGNNYWCALHPDGLICSGKLAVQSDAMNFSKLYFTSTFVCGQTLDNTLQCWGTP